MEKITAALLGAGGRGRIYASYALSHPHEMQVVAVADPDSERREKVANDHGIPEDMRFTSWEQLLEKPKLADAMMICTQDRMHFEPAIKSIEKGYHILLEKPISPDPVECIVMGEYAKQYKRVFSICHVLRYTNIASTVKKLLDEGRIGKLVSIQHNENVAYWHQAHSFVRGNWRNSTESSPMILAKCCHDLDFLLWVIGADCVKLSSFGSLAHFKKENAPEGAPMRCLDGCPAEYECPYYAPKLYLTGNTAWPTSAVSNDLSVEGITRALKTGPYGRCVYHCDNDVVDHQVISMEFANDVTVAFTMCAFTNDRSSRTTKFMGTKGEIRLNMGTNEIEVNDFVKGQRDLIYPGVVEGGHGGGDTLLMNDFVRLVQKDGAVEGLTSASVSIKSHLLAFAAEKSRLENKVVFMEEYEKEIMKKRQV